MNTIQEFANLILHSRHTVFFGGAGVSTESGIPDFRSAEGLYRQKSRISPETIISYSFFVKEPEAFYTFYREKLLSPGALPNQCHLALARLEELDKLACVITQNIDGLHQLAGSKKVLELHGATARNYCQSCGKQYSMDYVLKSAGVPRCACGGLIRPDVVLYEEALDEGVVSEAIKEIRACDLLIVGGTSLTVYPAAAYAAMCEGALVIINRDKTPLEGRADLVFNTSLGATFEAVMPLIEREISLKTLKHET